MKRVLLLAWRYIAFNKIKTTIMTACIALTLALPLAVHMLVVHYGDALTARARVTPLVLGAKGNRYDLVLKSLSFRPGDVDCVSKLEVDHVRDSELGLPIPLHLRYTARQFPLVGTSLEYFEFRGLQVREGTLPLMLGQAVLGANVAQALDMQPGDTLFSDQRSLYDISKTYPLKIHVVGVLQEARSPDDDAVFVDIKTAWIIDGVIHGHRDVVADPDPRFVLEQSDKNVVTDDSIIEYNEVTPENIDSFHPHGGPQDFPVTAVLVLPHDDKSATLLTARYNASKTTQMLVPTSVVEELMGVVFRAKQFFDANFALVTLSTILFIILVVMLSRRIRKREMETMYKIGCSRGMVFSLQAVELGIVLLMSVAAAGVLSGILFYAFRSVHRIL